MGKVVDVFKLVNPKDKKVCEHVGNVTFPGLVRTQILTFRISAPFKTIDFTTC